MVPELIIKFRADQAPKGLDVPTGRALPSPLHGFLKDEGLSLRPLKVGLADYAAAPAAEIDRTGGQGFLPYWSVVGGEERLGSLQTRLLHVPGVDAAYVTPAPDVPNGVVPEEPTPDFQGRQGYLRPAPEGVDALYAWTRPGGTGEGVNIIDIEGDWVLDHEELVGRVAADLSLKADPNANWQGNQDRFLQHGTAVLGQLVGLSNGQGITGISSGAKTGVVSHMHYTQPNQPAGPATAIAKATQLLRPGDVMLLEMHMPGPRYGFTPTEDQSGYIAVEWWEHLHRVIKDATDRGILVVQAAGNGGEDLDDALFDKPGSGFSASWKNPFRRENDPTVDSGAIFVGAGYAPQGTVGIDRERLPFSNCGSTLDAQGWGEEVVTSGYGDLQNNPDHRRRYTATFSGTSSAAPMIAGVLACVQGVLRAAGAPLLTPKWARSILRSTGSPQRWPAGKLAGSERIGSRPDLLALIDAAMQVPVG